jgi:hypothetical protein
VDAHAWVAHRKRVLPDVALKMTGTPIGARCITNLMRLMCIGS